MTNLPILPISGIRKPLFEEFDQLTKLLDDYVAKYPRGGQLVHRIDNTSNPVSVEIEVPGVDPAEVKVKIEGRSLSVETPRGNSYVTIGQRLDADGATANLKHGLLTIKVPKRDAKIVNVVVNED